MGWTTLHKDPRESVRAFMTGMYEESGDWKVIDMASNLTAAYIALEGQKEHNKGVVECAVLKIAFMRNEYYNFGYKDMDEFMGPCEVECPERILKLLTPLDDERDPRGRAREWRRECWEHINRRRGAAKPGQTIRFEKPLTFTDGQQEDTFLLQKGRGGRGVYFCAAKSGRLYRITNWHHRPYAVLDEEERHAVG